jgi:murein DD-endopeptidase MepM/ murein hydrolase activator NlpD
MRLIVFCALAFAITPGLLCAQETAAVRVADGFQLPVGPNGSGEGYYVARGYRPNGHLGEDWNGVKGGDTDLGDPIYATAHGLVVYAKNYHVGWGNVVIIRHAYYEGSSLKFVDSLYGHLLDFKVQEGEQVKRGQLIGHLGNNNGMYDAHLHFEMRKNLAIGMYRSSFARDFTNYWSPSEFIAARRTCSGGNRIAQVPINTFPANAPPSYAGGPQVHTPVYTAKNAPKNPALSNQTDAAGKPTTPIRRGTGFRVDRFEDLRREGGY